MLTNEEELKLKNLMKSNPEFAYFVNKLNQEAQLLVSQISHEIRNPLTLIKSTVQLIETMHPETKEFKFWDQLTNDINDTEALLTELSMYNNGGKISIQSQDLLLLLKSVQSTFRPQAEQRGINLSLSISDSDIPYFTSFPHDRIKLQQVFHNLIRNAFDATERGNYIKIQCKAHAPSHITIGIHNNGKVIPEEILPTIFDPFVTYKPGGSGLGLPISAKIIKAHNGIITVSSSDEQTSFIVNLPLK